MLSVAFEIELGKAEPRRSFLVYLVCQVLDNACECRQVNLIGYRFDVLHISRLSLNNAKKNACMIHLNFSFFDVPDSLFVLKLVIFYSFPWSKQFINGFQSCQNIGNQTNFPMLSDIKFSRNKRRLS